MQPTTLENFVAEHKISLLPNGLRFEVDRRWIVPGEDRVSYTTLVRLAECCREHHWKKDVTSLAPNLDSILCTLKCRFIMPISPGVVLSICYHVSKVWDDRYLLALDIDSNVRHAKIDMTCVFYDPIIRGPLKPPDSVIVALRDLKTCRDNES